MEILYVLQQSIYNNEGKWLTGDSNVNMMVGMLREVTNIMPHWKFKILIAPLKDFADIESYDEIFEHENVKFIPFKFPVNAFTNRQNFSVDAWEKVLNRFKPDIVWNNITEISRNIKTLLVNQKIDSRLITTCYWLDAPMIGQEKVDKAISYDWRQFDGFECSDLVVFTCNSTRNAWIKNARKKFRSKFVDKILEKSVVWDFGFSIEESKEMINEKMVDEICRKTNGKKIIMFLNRLSGINYTHHMEFIEAVNLLAEERDDFVVMFTNPSQKVSWENLKRDVKSLFIWKTSPLTRKEYFSMLKAGDISVHLFEKELYGGCANVESLYMENICVMPNINEYSQRGISYKYPGFIKDIKPITIKKALKKALDHKGNEHILNTKKYVAKNSSFEDITINVIRDIITYCKKENI